MQNLTRRQTDSNSPLLDRLADLDVPRGHLLGFCVNNALGAERRPSHFGFYSPPFDEVRLMLYRGEGRDGASHRLLTFTTDMARSLIPPGETPRSGGLDDASLALGLLIDGDADQRRIPLPEPPVRVPTRVPTKQARRTADTPEQIAYEDALEAWEHHHLRQRGYAPLVTDFYGMANDVLTPTSANDSGGGCPCVYLFDEPVPVPGNEKYLTSLAQRFYTRFKVEAEGIGWTFDSPHPLTSWVRIPGSYRPDYDHIVTQIAEGPSYSLAQIEEVAVPEGHQQPYSGRYWDPMEKWDGELIPRPDGRRQRRRPTPDRRVPSWDSTTTRSPRAQRKRTPTW